MYDATGNLFREFPDLLTGNLLMLHSKLITKVSHAGLRFRKLDVRDIVQAILCVSEEDDVDKCVNEVYEKICHRHRDQEVCIRTALTPMFVLLIATCMIWHSEFFF